MYPSFTCISLLGLTIVKRLIPLDALVEIVKHIDTNFVQVLQLVRQLFINCGGRTEEGLNTSLSIPSDTSLTTTSRKKESQLNVQNFLSKKITNKVVTQLQVNKNKVN